MIKLLSKLGLMRTNSSPITCDEESYDRYALWHTLPEKHLVLFIGADDLLHCNVTGEFNQVDMIEKLLLECPSIFVSFFGSETNIAIRSYLTALFKAEFFERLLGITQDFSKVLWHILKLKGVLNLYFRTG